MKKAVKRRILIFGTISMICIGYFMFELFNYSYNIIRLNNLKKTLESDLLVLKEKEASLKIDYTKLQDPEYIARYARQNYLYSKDGEYIIQINNKTNDKEEETSSNSYLTYYVIVAGIVATLVMIRMNKVRKDHNKKRNSR